MSYICVPSSGWPILTSLVLLAGLPKAATRPTVGLRHDPLAVSSLVGASSGRGVKRTVLSIEAMASLRKEAALPY